MKSLLIVMFLIAGNSFAQNLSPAEQRQLLNDVKELKNKVHKLEAEKSNSNKGLKTIDYNGGTTERTNSSTTPAAPTLSSEQTQELMHTLQKAKAHQEAQIKALEDLENEE
jgi:hypothetical protein